MTQYADIADLPEDERIARMIHLVKDHKKTVGFFVDDDTVADRYVAKMEAHVRIIERMPASKVFKEMKGLPVVFVKVGPLLD